MIFILHVKILLIQTILPNCLSDLNMVDFKSIPRAVIPLKCGLPKASFYSLVNCFKASVLYNIKHNSQLDVGLYIYNIKHGGQQLGLCIYNIKHKSQLLGLCIYIKHSQQLGLRIYNIKHRSHLLDLYIYNIKHSTKSTARSLYIHQTQQSTGRRSLYIGVNS
jgi:hypothetical protein